MNNNASPSAVARDHVRLQRWLLRLAAVISFIALPAVLLPQQIIEKLSWLVGYGQPPPSALLFYFGAGGSFVYVALGVMFWMFSNDVVRYRPLVLASAWISLLGGPAYLWMDWQCGLPGWWIAMDSISCLLFGVALLWTCRIRERRET